MSFNINYVVLVDCRLTRDPELKYLQSGKSVLHFDVAQDDSYTKKDGEKVEGVNYFSITQFGASEKFVEYLRKGTKVAIEGSLKQDRWQDKEGKNRSAIKIIARNVLLMGQPEKQTYKKQGSYSQQEQIAAAPALFESAPITDQDVPF